MAVNKVVVGDEVLIDLTKDTVTPEDVRSGVTFHMNSGEEAMGTCTMNPSSETVNPSLINKGLVNKVVSKNNILIDLTQDTIAPYDVKKGKTFHMRNGEYTVGTYEDSISLTISYDYVPDAFYESEGTSSLNYVKSTNTLRGNLYVASNSNYGIILTIKKNNEENFVNPTFTCDTSIIGTYMEELSNYAYSNLDVTLNGTLDGYSLPEEIDHIISGYDYQKNPSLSTTNSVIIETNKVYKELQLYIWIGNPTDEEIWVSLTLSKISIDGMYINNNLSLYSK